MKPRYWLIRSYIAANVFVTCSIALFEPNSVIYRVVQESGFTGSMSVGVLMCLAFVALCDVLINDLMPARYRFEWSFDYRHLLYMWLAMGLVSVSAVIIKSIGPSPLLLRFWLDALLAALVAFLDTYSRHRECAR